MRQVIASTIPDDVFARSGNLSTNRTPDTERRTGRGVLGEGGDSSGREPA